MLQARNPLLPIILVSGSLLCSSGSFGAEAARSSYASEIVKDVREDKVYLLENIRHKVTKPSEKTLVDALLSEDGPKAASLYRKQLSEYPDPQLDDISRSRLAAYDRSLAATAKPVMNAPKPGTASSPLSATNAPAIAARKPDTVSRQASAPTPLKPASPVLESPAATAARKADSVAKAPKAPSPKPATAAQPTAPANARTPAPAASKPVTGSTYTLQFGSFDSAANADQLAAQLAPSAQAKVVVINGVYKVRLKRTFATREEAGAFRHSLPIESFVVTDQQ
ncbi:MAG: SPOR domain-containing protein [Chlorobiaceae bacterium]|nr:SPOR domain-containing protein [Chlorobiaceae bacterium]